MKRVYFRDDLGNEDDCWDWEHPGTDRQVSIIRTVEADEYYLSQIPAEFHNAVRNAAYNDSIPFGKDAFLLRIQDIVSTLSSILRYKHEEWNDPWSSTKREDWLEKRLNDHD